MAKPMTRRTLLGSVGLLGGCAGRKAPIGTLPVVPFRLPRVRVSPDRVIRTIVGLRPFRPSGFVVRAEKLDDKLVVHNYGHGGAGITLSWGTAQLAVDEGVEERTSAMRGLGCGVVGLSTARLLQQRGYRPVIYARDDAARRPPRTSRAALGPGHGV